MFKTILIIILVMIVLAFAYYLSVSTTSPPDPLEDDEWAFVINDLSNVEYPASWDTMYISLFQDNIKRLWARYGSLSLSRSQIYALVILHWFKYGPGYMKDGMMEYFIVRSNTLLVPYTSQFTFQVQFKEDKSDEKLKNWLFRPVRTLFDWIHDDSINIESDKVYCIDTGAPCYCSYNLQEKRVDYHLYYLDRSLPFNHFCETHSIPASLEASPSRLDAYVDFLQHNNIDTI